jgi:hypothetical protein
MAMGLAADAGDVLQRAGQLEAHAHRVDAVVTALLLGNNNFSSVFRAGDAEVGVGNVRGGPPTVT